MQQPRNTWAGNQPFKTQPKLALVDAGGNTLSDISGVDVDVTVVQSLSQTSDIVIDTKLDPVPSVTSIRLHPTIIYDNRTSYSNGHNITIVVDFSQEIIVSKPPDANEQVLPTLTLNIINSEGSDATAHLSEATKIEWKTTELNFVYTVDVNYLQSCANIFDGVSLRSNGYFIKDGWDRNASLVIPSSSIAKTALVVHNQPAHINELTSVIPTGEYGAGHDIYLSAEFSDMVRQSLL